MLVDSPFLDPSALRPWVSGDRIALLPDGSFRHLGRVDGVLKIGSTRVSIAELEARLLAIPGVTDAAAIAVEVGGARGWESRALVAGTGSRLHRFARRFCRGSTLSSSHAASASSTRSHVTPPASFDVR